MRRADSSANARARLEYRVADRLNLFVNAENLLDASIQTGRAAAGIVSYDAPRIVVIGLAYRRSRHRRLD